MPLSRDIDTTKDTFCNVITDNSFHSSAESLFPLLFVWSLKMYNTSQLYLNEREGEFIIKKIIKWDNFIPRD